MTQDQGTSHGFSDPDAVARYAEGPRRQVPGYDSLLAMTDILLAEHVPDDGRILIIGAGGGLEMTHFARNHPGWGYLGVDPSAEMLALAVRTMQEMSARAELVRGYVHDAPPGPFDGATCILTLHFVPLAERLATLRAIRARLKPKAPFLAAHYSVPGDPATRSQWFARVAAFAERNGIPADKARANADRIAAMLPILTPEEDEALLTRAGFTGVSQFYAALTFRGWVCTA